MSSIWFNRRHWSGEVLGDVVIPSLYRDIVSEGHTRRYRGVSTDTGRNESIESPLGNESIESPLGNESIESPLGNESIDSEGNIIQIGDRESRDRRRIVLFTYHRGDMTEWGMDERYIDNKERLILVECISEYDYTVEDPTMVYRQNRDVLITVKEIEQYLLDKIATIELLTYDTREYYYMDLLDMLSVMDIFKREYPDHDTYSHEVEYPLGRDTSELLLLVL